MPVFGPIKRHELVHFLKQAGFQGPYSGGKHQYMVRGEISIRIPNPHQSDIGKELLARILRQAQITKKKWEKL